MPGHGGRRRRGQVRGKVRRDPGVREQRLVAGTAQPQGFAARFASRRPHGRGFRLRQGIRNARPQRGDQRPQGLDDRLAGLVAGRLWPLRAAVHPDGVAQRGHVPRSRRPRRRRIWPAAFCAAQQLAGQCEPRQGASPAVADQAEIRPEALMGGSFDSHRQRRPRIDGLQDLRFRRRTRGQLGGRRFHLLGSRGRVAG